MSTAATGYVPSRRRDRAPWTCVRARIAPPIARDPVQRVGAADATLRTVLHDLLAPIDPTAAPRRAAALAARFDSLAALAAAPERVVAAVAGPAAAALLAAHARAALRASREAAFAGPVLTTRYELLEYLHRVQGHAASERLRILFLDAGRMLIAEETVAGGAGGVAIAPREVIARALEHGAAGLILVHNHPGGDPTPSAADHAFTRALARAAALFDIRLHDHLVVARGGHACVVAR